MDEVVVLPPLPFIRGACKPFGPTLDRVRQDGASPMGERATWAGPLATMSGFGGYQTIKNRGLTRRSRSLRPRSGDQIGSGSGEGDAAEDTVIKMAGSSGGRSREFAYRVPAAPMSRPQVAQPDPCKRGPSRPDDPKAFAKHAERTRPALHGSGTRPRGCSSEFSPRTHRDVHALACNGFLERAAARCATRGEISNQRDGKQDVTVAPTGGPPTNQRTTLAPMEPCAFARQRVARRTRQARHKNPGLMTRAKVSGRDKQFDHMRSRLVTRQQACGDPPDTDCGHKSGTTLITHKY